MRQKKKINIPADQLYNPETRRTPLDVEPAH